MKKSLTILCLTQAIFAHANTDTTTAPALPLTLSTDPSGYSASAQFIYLRPLATGGNESGLQLPATNSGSNTLLEPTYAPGFKVEVGRQLDKGLGLYLNWYHFDSTYHNSFAPFISANGEAVTSTSSRLNPVWDTINFEVGRVVNQSNFGTMRFHSGLQFTRIFVGEMSQQTYNAASGVISNTQTIDHLFNGFGIRFGLSTEQHYKYGFTTYVHAATAMLAGRHSQNILNTNTTLVTSTPTSHFARAAIVPEVEAEGGGAYAYSIQNGPLKGELSANIGWMWLNFISSLFHASYTPTTNSFSQSEYNFAVEGPTVGIRWHSS